MCGNPRHASVRPFRPRVSLWAAHAQRASRTAGAEPDDSPGRADDTVNARVGRTRSPSDAALHFPHGATQAWFLFREAPQVRRLRTGTYRAAALHHNSPPPPLTHTHTHTWAILIRVTPG